MGREGRVLYFFFFFPFFLLGELRSLICQRERDLLLSRLG